MCLFLSTLHIQLFVTAVSGLATETEMNIKETQDMIAEDAQKTEEFEVNDIWQYNPDERNCQWVDQ